MINKIDFKAKNLTSYPVKFINIINKINYEKVKR